MTRSIVWFLLVLSLLFNVFFVFGYMQAKTSSLLQNGGIAETNRITEFVGNELKLDDKQREVFSKLRKEMRVFDESIALSYQGLLNELENETPNLSEIRNMVVEQTDLHSQRRVERSHRFHEFLKTLSPDQCRRLSDRVGRSRHGRDRFQRMLRKFDENKNGVLDEDEMAKAKAEHKARRDQWKKEMLEKYDSNGNGVIDEVERGAMRENWPQRPRRGRRIEDTGPKDN